MSEKRFVLGVDLDGVCADYYGGLRPIAAEWLDKPIEALPEEVSWDLAEWGIDEAPGGYDALHRFAVTQRELFEVLDPMPQVGPVLRRLSHEKRVRVRIITHRLIIPYFHQVAVSQTVEWLDRHDIPYWDLCFMGEKAAVGAHVYIEDSPANVKRLRDAGHLTIVFGNSTNRNLPPPRGNHWLEIEELVHRELDRWKVQDD